MTVRLTFNQFLTQTVSELEQSFYSLVPQEWNVEPTLLESIHYSLFAGGKRIRPALLFAVLECMGKTYQIGMPAACSLEMIHTYSLIHDDLPSMDNDDFRRGKPTNHIVYGEAIAILAGDGLLTHAFYMLTRLDREHVSHEAIIRSVEELSKLSGLLGMVSGQAADIRGEQGITSLDQLAAIHRDKTGALIACSLKLGGLIGGAGEHQLIALEQFGYKLGLAFQIQDDILDLVGNQEKLGKPLQSDEKSGKVTYPFFLGIDRSRAELAKLTAEAKQIVLSAGFENPTRLLEIADFLLARDY